MNKSSSRKSIDPGEGREWLINFWEQKLCPCVHCMLSVPRAQAREAFNTPWITNECFYFRDIVSKDKSGLATVSTDRQRDEEETK
jgi:hypothetical protein